ncbi:MAG TPA: dihydropteroate synthase, partial [Agromyces sp.]|nr:dihydropteroate synthase [Agromyces sp.]
MTGRPADGGSMVRRIGPREFDFAREVAVMAIVNRTPDSFYDKGRTDALDAAVAAAHRAIDEGADWIDVGGAKFAPGPAIPVGEEIERVVPVVAALAGSGAVISVDTFHPGVARAAMEAGAHVVNDTTGLHDPVMADVVAETGATIVVTH